MKNRAFTGVTKGPCDRDLLGRKMTIWLIYPAIRVQGGGGARVVIGRKIWRRLLN